MQYLRSSLERLLVLCGVKLLVEFSVTQWIVYYSALCLKVPDAVLVSYSVIAI
jgi:hypothetical protein